MEKSAILEHGAEGSLSRPTSEENEELDIDPKAEVRLIRKLDLHIIPVLFCVYFMCYLDRANIGNAKIQGMTDDLQLTGNRYNVALMVFFVPYILFEVPSNMILRHTRPSFYLATLVISWGLVNMCMGFVQNFASLVALRFLLGIFEAGLYPGMVYLVSMYYKRHETQKRMSGIWNANLLSSAFSGLLAYAISHLAGQKGYGGWRWIFIIEGAITIFVGIIAMPFIPDWPQQSRYLKTEEKALLAQRMKLDTQKDMEKLDRRSFRLIVRDWKIWLTGLVNYGTITSGYSMNYFLPTILNQLGWQAADAQVHTIPPYMVAWVILLAFAVLSDKAKIRYPFVLIPGLFATIGYIMLLNQAALSVGARYAATFFITTGSIITPICLTWLLNNLSGHWKRAFGSATANMTGQFAGLVASNVWLSWEAPVYTTGYSVALASTWIGILSATVLLVALHRENKARDRGERNDRLMAPAEEVANLGDDHPSFRFTY